MNICCELAGVIIIMYVIYNFTIGRLLSIIIIEQVEFIPIKVQYDPDTIRGVDYSYITNTS